MADFPGRVKICREKNCAWCEVNGRFLFGKNPADVSAVLDLMAAGEKRIAAGAAPMMSDKEN